MFVFSLISGTCTTSKLSSSSWAAI